MNAAARYEGSNEARLLALLEAKEQQIEAQQRQLEAQAEKIVQLEALVKSLRKELEEAKRASHRQATPFSKGKRKKNPKKPGRRAGEGQWSRRQAPEAGPGSVPAQEVPVQQSACPYCGGELEEAGFEEVSNTDLPKMPQPQVRRYRVHKARCRGCNATVRGRHEDVASDQTGATAHRVGVRAMAAAHVLHYEVGVTVRKVPEALWHLTGLDITQSAVTQDALKQAREGAVGEAYEGLRGVVQYRNAVNTDTTSWKVGAEKSNLGVFDTPYETVYQVRSRARNEEVREVVPSDYQGTMGSDRASCFDAKELSRVKKQKCLSHVQRDLSEALEGKEGEARLFAEPLKELLHEAIELHKAYHAGVLSLQQYLATGRMLDAAVGLHLLPRLLPDPRSQTLLNELGEQHREGHLLRFLGDPSIEPTNNRAERELRPAVIARKVSQCSKTETGAYAFSAFKSVLRTLKKRSIPLIDGLVALLGGRLELAPAPPL
jgi:transposase